MHMHTMSTPDEVNQIQIVYWWVFVLHVVIHFIKNNGPRRNKLPDMSFCSQRWNIE